MDIFWFSETISRSFSWQGNDTKICLFLEIFIVIFWREKSQSLPSEDEGEGDGEDKDKDDNEDKDKGEGEDEDMGPTSKHQRKAPTKSTPTKKASTNKAPNATPAASSVTATTPGTLYTIQEEQEGITATGSKKWTHFASLNSAAESECRPVVPCATGNPIQIPINNACKPQSQNYHQKNLTSFGTLGEYWDLPLQKMTIKFPRILQIFMGFFW
jgi:hypothetical protein